jgi:hypothetical protein
MSRRVLLIAALPVFAAALTWSLAAEQPKQPTEARPAAKAEPSPADRLAQRLAFSGIDDPAAKFGEALDKLARESGLAFDVNEAAFREEMIDDVLSRPIGAVLPKMKNVTVQRVLNKLLALVQAPSGTTFLVRREAIEITTGHAQLAEVWSLSRNPAEIDRSPREPRLPLVNAEFDRKPLGEALKELSRQSGMNVMVDARVAEKARAPVTARFRNTPLDTAVQTLADMVDLKPFLLDNVLYVTARDNADRLEERERPRNPTVEDLTAPGPWRVGNGPPQGRGVRAPDGAGM